MSRICPNCSITLGSYDSYFCSNCGVDLPDTIVLGGKDYLRVVSIGIEDIPQHSLKDLLLPVFKHVAHTINIKDVILVSIGLVLLVPVYMFLRTLDKDMTPTTLLPQESTSVANATIDVEDVFKAHIFGADFVTEYVPSDVDVYLEGHDFHKFAELIGATGEEREFLTEKLAPYLVSHFAYFAKFSDDSMSWGLVLFPLEEFWTDHYEQLNLGDRYHTSRIDSVLILSNSENTLTNVSNAKEKLIKNLSLNPKYAQYKSHLSKSGQFMVIAFTPAGRSFIEGLSQMDLPEEFTVLLNRYLEQSSDYVVFD